MTDARSILRTVLIYTVCLPLAIVLGYMVATGNFSLETRWDFTSTMLIELVLAVLVTPILLRWHHPLTVLTWNTTAVLFFLPGHPRLGLLVAAASLLITILQYALNRQLKPIYVPGVARPLLLLAAVAIVTAALTGGIGFRTLGSEVGGGGRYVMLGGAILGFFALSAHRIPPEKANLYVGLFFLFGLTQAIGSIAPFLPPDPFYYLFLFFPVERMGLFAEAWGGVKVSESRLYGTSIACLLSLFYLLARFGLRGILTTRPPWRLVLFLALWVGVMYGGWRSFVFLGLAVMGVQFFLEGLHKTRLLPLLVLAVLLVSAVVLPLTDRLPWQIQRSLAWLPVPVDAEVQINARASTEWRQQMWQRVWPQVPRYLLLGKGYALDVREMEMVQQEARLGRTETALGAEFVGDYHNGPLSVLVPLGLLGAVALLGFWWGGWRVLLHNYRNSPPELRLVNTLLLALFTVRVFHFLFIFGSLHSDLAHFTGLVGLSLALNGGLAARKAAPVPATQPAVARLRPLGAPLPPPVTAKQ